MPVPPFSPQVIQGSSLDTILHSISIVIRSGRFVGVHAFEDLYPGDVCTRPAITTSTVEVDTAMRVRHVLPVESFPELRQSGGMEVWNREPQISNARLAQVSRITFGKLDGVGTDDVLHTFAL